MNSFPEIPCSTIVNKDDKSYRVRQFGYSGEIYEEHLIPIPVNRTIKTFKDDGTEDIIKRKTEIIKDD